MLHKRPDYKAILLSALLMTACSDSDDTAQSPNFSNMMIFGDSLSDIGNFPQNIYYDGDTEATSTEGIATNLYVSVSNPVDDNTFIPLYPNELQLPRQTQSYRVIEPKTLPGYVCTGLTSETADCNERQGRGVNWLQLFGYNAGREGPQHMFESVTLASWVALQDRQWVSDNNLSIVYAWFAANSYLSGCYNANEDPLDTSYCSRQNIYQFQNQYRASQRLVNSRPAVDADTGYKLGDAVVVPTLQQQVETMFFHDFDRGQAKVDPDTLYVVYNGTNDLQVVLSEYLAGNITGEALAEQLWNTIPNHIAGEGGALGALLKGLASRQITSGNVLMIPQYHYSMLAVVVYEKQMTNAEEIAAVSEILEGMIGLFNRRLGDYLATTAESYAGYDYFYAQSLFHNVAKMSKTTFKATGIDPCNENSTIYLSGVIQSGETSACTDTNDDPFFYWNTLHPSAFGQQVVAKSVFETLQGGTFNTHRETLDSQAEHARLLTLIAALGED